MKITVTFDPANPEDMAQFAGMVAALNSGPVATAPLAENFVPGGSGADKVFQTYVNTHGRQEGRKLLMRLGLQPADDGNFYLPTEGTFLTALQDAVDLGPTSEEQVETEQEQQAAGAAAAAEGKVYQVGDVREALKAYAEEHGKEIAIAILQKHKAASISELDPSKYASVMAACSEAPA